MTLWAWLGISLFGGLGLIGVLDRVRRHRDRWDGRYTEQIAILKTDKPLALPTVKPLHARVLRTRRKSSAKPTIEFKRRTKGTV